MALKFTRLTRPAVRTLKFGDRLNEHGIIAEKQRNGDVRYSINIMVDGQRIHRVVGRESEGTTRFQAEQLIEKLRSEARAGRLDLPTGRKLHRIVKDSAEEYLRRQEESGGKNLANKRRHFEQHLTPFFGRHRLDRLTEFEMRKYRKHRQGEGAKDATINRELATLSHLLSCAASKDWKWIKPEARPDIPMVKEARKPIRILTAADSARLLKAASEDQDGYSWLFVLFGLNTAMRHGEILQRRYDEIDWENCRIWIDKAKSGERVQPITPALRDALKKQQGMEDEPEGWIFPNTHARAKSPHRQSMAKQFIRVVKRAELDPRYCTPHIMRHTGISRLVMAGADIPTIQKISGHKTVQMVMHYTHVFGNHIDRAMSVLDTGFSDAVTPALHTGAGRAYEEGATVTPIKNEKSAA
jgi:integrase